MNNKQENTKKPYYAVIYFGPRKGGFAHRMDMLCDVLRQKGKVIRIHTFSGLLRFLAGRQVHCKQTSVIIYSDLMVPLAMMLRMIHPTLPIYYMVRGDQYTWARHTGRHFRAIVAKVLQKMLKMLGCRFIFASADLRDVFYRRLGGIKYARILPNTLGIEVPQIKTFDGNVAVVGDFKTVKNIENVLEQLSDGLFDVNLYGNSCLPECWRQSWLSAHGHVDNLTHHLSKSSLLVLASVSEGFPNVLLDALDAGCGIVAHQGFPFRHLKLNNKWQFALSPTGGSENDLKSVLCRLKQGENDFKEENKRLIAMVESDWNRRILDIFE